MLTDTVTAVEAQALAMLALSWRRAPVPADYRPGVPRTDPPTPEEVAAEKWIETGPGAWLEARLLVWLEAWPGARLEARLLV